MKWLRSPRVPLRWRRWHGRAMARFRLERVRRLREQLRRQAERAVGETVHAIAANEAQRAALRAARVEDWSAAVEHLLAGMAAGELDLHVRYGALLAAHEADAALAADQLEVALTARRQLLRGARLEERKLEQLRTRFAAREAAAADRSAARLLDELALRRHATRR
jgi:flagellar export protein FliJ